MQKPKQQGNLDGLCGVYSIVNALRKLNLSQDTKIFETCCRSLAPSRWPQTLWEGTTLRDLETMIKACRTHIHGMKRIQVSYPFRAIQPPSNDAFWSSFGELFEDNRRGKCAIIGLTEPAMHWLVAAPKGKSIIFSDSDSHLKENSIKRNKIYAGSRRTNDETHRIDRKEVILFERLP